MEQSDTSSSLGKCILLVEDHEDSAEMMTLFLEGEGYRVRWVSTASDALRAVEDAATPDRPDLILLDLTLPDSNGLELGQRLRADVPNAPPVIILSAKSAQDLQVAATAMAATAFVRKPFAVNDLMTTIESALKS